MQIAGSDAEQRPEPSGLLDKNSFAELVEERVFERGVSYIEAVLEICDERSIDPSDVAKLVDGAIRDKLEVEGMRKSLLPKKSSLSGFIG